MRDRRDAVGNIIAGRSGLYTWHPPWRRFLKNYTVSSPRIADGRDIAIIYRPEPIHRDGARDYGDEQPIPF